MTFSFDAEQTQVIATAEGSSTTASVSLVVPSGVAAGDFLLVTVGAWSGNSDSLTLPGYAPAGQSNYTRIFTRTATGAESGTTITCTNGYGAGPHVIAIQVFRGVPGFVTRGIQYTYSGTTTYDSPSTGMGARRVLLQHSWFAINSPTGTAITVTPNVALSNKQDVGAGNLRLVMGFEYQDPGLATASVSRQATASASSEWSTAVMSYPALQIAHPPFTFENGPPGGAYPSSSHQVAVYVDSTSTTLLAYCNGLAANATILTLDINHHDTVFTRVSGVSSGQSIFSASAGGTVVPGLTIYYAQERDSGSNYLGSATATPAVVLGGSLQGWVPFRDPTYGEVYTYLDLASAAYPLGTSGTTDGGIVPTAPATGSYCMMAWHASSTNYHHVSPLIPLADGTYQVTSKVWVSSYNGNPLYVACALRWYDELGTYVSQTNATFWAYTGSAGTATGSGDTAPVYNTSMYQWITATWRGMDRPDGAVYARIYFHTGGNNSLPWHIWHDDVDATPQALPVTPPFTFPKESTGAKAGWVAGVRGLK